MQSGRSFLMFQTDMLPPILISAWTAHFSETAENFYHIIRHHTPFNSMLNIIFFMDAAQQHYNHFKGLKVTNWNKKNIRKLSMRNASAHSVHYQLSPYTLSKNPKASMGVELSFNILQNISHCLHFTPLCQTLSQVIKSRWMKYVTQTTLCRNHECIQKMRCKTSRKKRLQKTMPKWKDNIKMEYQKTEC